MDLLISAIEAVVTIVAVVALIFVSPMVLIWFFRRISFGAPKNTNTIRKIR